MSTAKQESNQPPITYLSEAQVRAHLNIDALIDAMTQALINYSTGRIAQPDRQMLPVSAGGGFFGAMPAAGESVGVKLVNFFPGNVRHGLPTHLALILLFRPETGEPLAMMDGRLITEMRTAAVSAAVVKMLAPNKTRVLSVLGTGLQARAHAQALGRVRNFNEILLWGRDADKASALAYELGARAVPVEEAVRQGDVVVTATSATEPILQGEWLKPGAIVAAVGWNSPDGHELDAAAMNHTVVVESRSGTQKESGNIRAHNATIFAEAGEILSGTKTVEPDATVVFDSIGMACEDVAAAQLVWDQFNKAGA